MKKHFSYLTLIFFLLVIGNSCVNKHEQSGESPAGMDPFPQIETGDSVVPAPEGTHPFYKKYTNAGGIIIVSSEKVSDEALLAARKTVLFILSKRPDVQEAMLKHHPRISIMASSEKASYLPEFDPESDGQWGLGQMPGDPTTLVSVAGICFPENQDYKANFLVHEFVHMMHNLGMPEVEPQILDEIYMAYKRAVAEGLFTPPKDEPIENISPFEAYGDDEYFTHAVNAWYNLNESLPGPWMDVKIGEHGPPSGTNQKLKEADPDIYAVISRFFPEYDINIFGDCQAPTEK